MWIYPNCFVCLFLCTNSASVPVSAPAAAAAGIRNGNSGFGGFGAGSGSRTAQSGGHFGVLSPAGAGQGIGK